MCNGTPCGRCTPQANIGPPGRGVPGATPDIDIAVEGIAAGASPTVVRSGTALNPTFTLGIPAGASPVFNPVVPTTTGLTASASIDNTLPLAPQLSLVLVNGEDGADGQSPWTDLKDPFTMPAINGQVQVTGTSFSWAPLGAWIFVAEAGLSAGLGGWMVVASPPFGADDQNIFLRNPGALDGIPAGVAFNRGAGGTITPNNLPNQVMISGHVGPAGAAGAAGAAPVITVVYTTPSAPPVTPADAFVFYADQTPPTPATTFVPYAWNGVSWVAGPNIAGARGSQTFFGTDDPNVVSPSGSAVGDGYWRQASGALSLFERINVSTWQARGTVPTQGSIPQDISHNAPGVETLDLAYMSYNIQADKPVELDWSDTNNNGQGEWIVSITNIDAGAIALTYTAARWERDPAVTLPVTIAPGDTQTLRFIKDVATGLMIFTSEFIAVAV